MNTEEMQKLIAEAPDKCPITGYKKCETYVIENNVVYLSNPPWDAYTLPEYDSDTQEFTTIRYDMDDDFRKEHQVVCTLDYLEESCRDDIDEVKAFFGIK